MTQAAVAEVAEGKTSSRRRRKTAESPQDGDDKGTTAIGDEGETENQNLGSEAVEAAATPKQKKKVKKRKDSERSNKTDDLDAGELLDHGGKNDENELTMAEKLASLDPFHDDNAKSTTGQDISASANPPSADSVHVLLKQALHADDHALLLDCLYTRDEKVIGKSVSLLNPADVLKLLKSLVSMLQLRGAVLVCALPWIRSLLGQHASSIASQESSLLILNSLYQLTQSRISTFGSALQLSTSLDYLFAGIPDAEADEESFQPIIYEDKDTDDEESEDAMDTENENEELGAVIDSPGDSDGSEVMSD